MRLNVRLFARARDLAGSDTVELDLPDATRVGDLRLALAERYPALRPLARHLLIAVGTDYATETTPLDPKAEVACFPPVSGG